MTQWSATEQVAAEVIFVDGSSLQGNLHLQPGSAHHRGSETPLEMLNRSESFFPVALLSGEIALVSKAQTAVVACGSASHRHDADRVSIAKAVALDVHVAGHEVIHGTASLELPPSHSRALDFLNEPERFFAVADGDTTWHVNRAHVRYVHPHD